MNARRQRNMLIAGAFSLVLASCHNPERKNPFDPELTPAVENVEATLDGTSGVVVVEWDAYDGAQPFGRYLVLRKVQGLEAVDTLSVITDRALTRFEDTSIEPDTDYIYRVTVANIAGFTVDSADLALRSFRIPEVELAEVVADNLQGTIMVASLPWSALYELHRAAPELRTGGSAAGPGRCSNGYDVDRQHGTSGDRVPLLDRNLGSRNPTIQCPRGSRLFVARSRAVARPVQLRFGLG